MGMNLDEITLRNFGPYYGKQSLQFGRSRPIVVVHGANMRGKTSLLNAIRWALYGHALDRFGKYMPTVKLINWDAAQSGDLTMSVVLRFRVDADGYELTRRVQPKDPLIPGKSDQDFEEKLYLEKNGYQLSSDTVQTEINRILPEQISLFFLFDGEMLNKYEGLLSSSDKQAQIIKDSIELILGVPSLSNAVSDLRINLKEAAKKQQQLAKKDKSAKVFAEVAAQLQADIDQLEEDLAGLQEERDKSLQKKQDLDEQLQATAAIETDVARLKLLQDQIQKLEAEQARLQEEERAKLTNAWRDLVQPKIQARIQRLEQESSAQMDGLSKANVVKTKAKDLNELLSGSLCPLCGSAVSDLDVAALQRKKAELEDELKHLSFDEEAWSKASESIRRLRRLSPAGVADTIGYIEKELMKVRVDLVDLEQLGRDLNERLKAHDQVAIARNRRDYDDVTKEIGVLESQIEGKEKLISDKQAEATRNRAQISKVGGPELERLNREVQLYESLIALFEKAIERLRDDLKVAVERDASEIFLQLTTDRSYKGLRINDYYGLAILDQKGGEVPVRSAGAEQIVALSLIGALNRNAIRKGPIVMDTPFGRLDPEHRENILKFIPTMSDQITLLVHAGEVDRERDMAHISGRIDREYEIVRVSSSQSRLELIKEDKNGQPR